MRKRGAPAGLLINPAAAKYALRGRPRLGIATDTGLSAGHLSEVFNGKKGVSRETADRLADALEIPVAVLFPQLAEFEVEVKRFVYTVDGEVAA